jgi:hypothetical protein
LNRANAAGSLNSGTVFEDLSMFLTLMTGAHLRS